MSEQIGLEAVFDMKGFNAGIDNYIGKVKEADGVTAKATGSFGSSYDKMGQSVLKAAGIMSGALVAGAAAAGAALTGFVAGGISSAMDLESQLGGIASIMGLTKDEIVPLKDLIVDLGLDPTLKVNAEEAADAIEKLGSNGLTMAQIMDGAAKSTVLLANSTGADFDTAAAVATDTMALFNISAENMQTAVDGITGVTVASKFGINDYRLALAQAGGVASAVGVEFDDFNASISSISSYFASGSDAGTSFKTMLQRMVPTTAPAAEAMAELGLITTNSSASLEYLADKGVKPVTGDMWDLYNQVVETYYAANDLERGAAGASEQFQKWAVENGVLQSAFFDQQGAMRGMDEVSVLLNESLQGVSEQEKIAALSAIFGTDAMRAAVGMSEAGAVAYTDQALAAKELGVSFESLTGLMEGGLTKFEIMNMQIGNTSAVDSAAVRMDNFKGSLEILQGVVDSVALEIGMAFLPMLKELAEWASAMVTEYSPMVIEFFQAFSEGLSNAIASGDWSSLFPPWLNATILLVQQNMDLLTGALGGLGVLLASAGIAAAISAIGSALAVALSPIGLAVIAAMALGAAWNTNFLGIKEATMSVITPIKDFITTALSMGLFSGEAAIALDKVKAALVTLAQSVLDQLGTWVANLQLWAAAVGEQLMAVDYMAIGSDILNLIKDGWLAAVGVVMPFIVATGTSIMEAFKLVDWLGLGNELLTLIGNGITAATAALLTVVTTVGTSIVTTLKAVDWLTLGNEVLTLIGSGWTAASTAVLALVTALGTSIGTTLKAVDWLALGNEILTAIGSGWTAAVPVFTALVTTLGTSIGTTLRAVDWLTLGTDILNAIGSGWTTATTAFAALVTALGASIGTTLRATDWLALGSEVLTAIGNGWTAAVTTFTGLVTALGASIGTDLRAIDWLALGTEILNAIGSGWTAAVGAFTALVTGLGDSAVTTLKATDWTGLGKTVLDTIGTGWTSAVAAFVALVTSLGNSAVTTLKAVDFRQLGIDVLTAIGAGWTATVATFTGLVGELGAAAVTKFKTTDWKQLGTDILNLIGTGLEAGKAAALAILTTIATAFKDQFGESIQNWKSTGQTILTNLGTGITAGKEAIVATVQTIAASMKERYITPEGFAWSTAGADIANGVRDGLKAAAEAAGGILTAVTTIATSIKDVFTSMTWSEIGTAIIAGIQAGMDTAIKAANGLLAAAGTAALDLGNKLKETDWQAVGAAIANLVRDGWNLAVKAVSGLIPAGTEAGNAVGDAIKAIDWSGVGQAIVNVIIEGIKLIVYGAAGLIYVASQIALGFAEEITGYDWSAAGQSVLTALVAGVELGKVTLTNKITEILTAIKKLFTDSIAQFKTIGTDIVNGIGEGISSAREALMSKAQALANSLPDWVRSVLGISSPSKVFAEIGRNVVQGLILGINDHLRNLNATMANLTGVMTQGKLLGTDFSVSDAFMKRLNDTFLGQLEGRAADVDNLRNSLQNYLKATHDGMLRSAQGSAEWTFYMKEGMRVQEQLMQLTRDNSRAQVDAMNAVLQRNKASRDAVDFMEDQIALMTEAKNLGIDVTGVDIGNQGIANVTKMALIEQQITDYKRQQLYLIAQQVKTQSGSQASVNYLAGALENQEGLNKRLSDQINLMKQAQNLGIDINSLWSGWANGVSLTDWDANKLLEIQYKLAQATGNQLRKNMQAMVTEQKRIAGLESAMKTLQPIIDQTDVSSAWGQRYKATVLDPMLAALEQAAGVDSERLRLMNAYTQAAQKLLDIRKKEEDLNFLQQQLDMVKMIQDQDIVGGNSLFEGIAFGVNASIDDLLTLTQRVLAAMVTEVKDELGIHSPSRVFAEIGANMMAGMAQGIQSNIMGPLSSLRQATVAHGAVTTRTLNFSLGGVNINNGMDEVMFESRVQRIIERSI